MALTIDARPSQPMPESQIPGNSIDITPRASGIDNRNLRSSNRRTNMGVTLVAGAAVLIGGAGSVFAQEGSPTPDTSFQPDGSPLPTDPITGAIICPPEVSPSPSLPVEPTPPVIAVVNGKEFTLLENTVTVKALAQEAPASPFASPLASGDPETALIDPCATPDASETPAPDYTLEALYKLGYNPIDIDQFNQILDEQISSLYDPSNSYGLSENQIKQSYEDAAKQAKISPGLNDGGQILAQSIKGNMKDASDYVDSNPKLAKAKFIISNAFRRVGQFYLDFGTNDHKEIDSMMDKLIKDFKL